MNQLIPDYPTNIVSINDSTNIRAIEKMLSWSEKSKDAIAHASPTRTNTHASPVLLVHKPSMVPVTRKVFTYGTASDPPSPFHDPSE